MCRACQHRDDDGRTTSSSSSGRLVRRADFVCAAAFTLLAGAAPLRVLAAAGATTGAQHFRLFIERVDTGEYANAAFTLDGSTVYWPGYEKLCAVLRDEHVAPRYGYLRIDVRAIEALWAVQQYLVRDGIDAPIVVHSGYRTPQTNAQVEGAARHSLHMRGMAVDFHVPGVSLSDLAGICAACPASGGVGYYPEGWVHLDTGPKRFWEG